MIVVADSGPLHYLVLLEHIDLLRRFYGQVLVQIERLTNTTFYMDEALLKSVFAPWLEP
jgi:predicted nucleic acid-binding protein